LKHLTRGIIRESVHISYNIVGDVTSRVAVLRKLRCVLLAYFLLFKAT